MILLAEADTKSGIQIELKYTPEHLSHYLVPISSHCCKEEYKLKDPVSRDKQIGCSCGKYRFDYVPHGRDRWYISSAWKESHKFVEWLAYWTGFAPDELEVDIQW